MKRAFTLAEVLITLGIIGIIAAMTLPSIIGRWQEKATVTKVEYSYSLLSQAYLKTIGENLDARDLGCQNARCLLTELSKNLKVLSFDYVDTPPLTTLNGDNSYNTDPKFLKIYRLELENGYIIYARNYFSPTCNQTYSTWDVEDVYKTICMSVRVDVNGDAKPNAFGRDIFHFYLLRDRVYPAGGPNEPYYSFKGLCKKNRDSDIWDGGYNGDYCTAWVLYNKNMDYLHCDDLSWKEKSKCGK